MIPRMNENGMLWGLRSKRVMTPDGIRPAVVLIEGQKISSVLAFDAVPSAMEVTDVGDKYILPGLIDSHVHINEPGRTDWEGFETATRAAAAGGITTLIDMPLNSSPVTTTVKALEAKKAAAQGKIFVDCGFHGGVVPGNTQHIKPLVAAGVCAFKAFLSHSGIDEFPYVSKSDLRQIMPMIAEMNVPLMVHAELTSDLPASLVAHFTTHPRCYRTWVAMRPADWEVAAIQQMIQLCRDFQCPVHIVHLSASLEAGDLLRAAKADGLPITVETCPHYLTFASEGIADGDPRFKCAPPIRSRQHQDALRELVLSGIIDTLGSDHSPAPPALKHLDDGDLKQAWGGIASVQLLLSAVWTALPDERVFGKLTQRPANLCGIQDRKGAIMPGLDADLIVFDPDGQFQIEAEKLFHRHKVTPYDGMMLRGVVEMTYLRGQKIFDQGRLIGEPHGQLLKRGA